MTTAPVAPPLQPPREPADRGAAESSTPTVRAFFRRWSFWVGAAAFIVVASLVLLVVRGATGVGDSTPLSITSPAPGGSQALAEVLRQQGVTVTAVDTLDGAQHAVASAVAAARASGASDSAAAEPTVLIYDPSQYLPGDRYDDVKKLGARLVLVQPDVFELEGIAPSISLAGAPDEPADNSRTVAAGCSLPAARAAEAITVSGTTYRATAAGTGGAAATGVISCFESGDGAYSLVTSRTGAGGSGSGSGSGSDGAPVAVLGAADVLTNAQIVNAGNAALALRLLGQSSSLIWYTPGADDVEATGPPSLAALTPGWVTPLILLLVLVFIAAAVWRGRRLGAVVVENLPVIVRGNETVTGRARLYARSGARLRAADALRIGTIARLGGMLKLPRQATLDEIILQVAVATGIASSVVAEVLVNRVPRTETDLQSLSRQLTDLERAVRQSVYGPTPTSPQDRTPKDNS